MQLDLNRIFDKKPPVLDFVLPGLVAGTVGSIVSPGGAGKSALALGLACAVAGGPNRLGIEVAAGHATYLSGEDGEIAMWHRLYAVGMKSTDTERADIQRYLTVETLDEENINIMSDDWNRFIHQKATGQRLLIVDTLRKIHTLDENDASSMSLVIGRMQKIASQTGCAIVFLHHTSKGAAMNGQGGEQQASRGSSVLVDNIRWQGYLVGMSEAEATELGVEIARRNSYVSFGVSKQNYGAKPDPIWLKKISCDDPNIAGGFTLEKIDFDRVPVVRNVYKK